MAQIERGGISSLFVAGATYEVSAEVTVKPGGETRKVVLSSNGVAGYTTEIQAGEIEFEALDGPQVAVTALMAAKGVPIQVRMNNGKSWLLPNASQIDQPSVKIHEGKISGLKFAGDPAREILA